MLVSKWFGLRKGMEMHFVKENESKAGYFRKAKRRMKYKLNGYKKLERENLTL